MPIVQQREEQIKSVQNIELRNLIRRCTNQEAGLRPSAEELITFFEGRVNLHSELK